MQQRPLLIPIVVAGQVLGLKSAEAAYANVPRMLQTISTGRKISVQAQALANLLAVSLDTLWATIESLEPAAEKMEGPTRREVLEQQVTQQEKSWAITDALEGAAKKAAA